MKASLALFPAGMALANHCTPDFFAPYLSPNANTSACFNAAQIDTLYKVYGDWIDTNQTFVFPSFAWGAEAQVSNYHD